MADLIVQGAEVDQRWRRALPLDQCVILGRRASWAIPWDDYISREHLELLWNGQKLLARQLPQARNPAFVHGQPSQAFELSPGEHFVLGNTTVSLADHEIEVSLDLPQPLQEQAFSAQYLKRMRFRDADVRIENLSRLPEIISSAANDNDLFMRLVNVLLSGVPRADAAAIVSVPMSGAAPRRVQVLHWDRRRLASGRFQPSERLIQEAIHRGESVLHTWNVPEAASDFTQLENYDWAFCTPVPGDACAGWGLYLAGKFAAEVATAVPLDQSPDLRDDLKFSELTAATLSSLRQLRLLNRRQAGLSQFFSPLVLEALEHDDPDVVLAPREALLTALFCDLRGFSLRSERESGDLLGLLRRVNQALGVMTHQILEHGGVVGDFQGDAAMGFWGWPLAQPDAIENAIQAAIGIRNEFSAAAQQPQHDLVDFQVGIGLATGLAVAGKIGTVDHMKVTVFGPVANRAARLESMTRQFGAAILLDDATANVARQRVPVSQAEVRRLLKVRPLGMDQAVEVSELVFPPQDGGESTAPVVVDRSHFDKAIAAFESGDWEQAAQLLGEIAPDDVTRFVQKVIRWHDSVPPPDWDGVLPLQKK